MRAKAIVLNSGGVDSTTCVAVAIERLGEENVVTASICYGQKHKKELECAKRIAEHYGVEHYELDLSNVFEMSNCSLLKNSDEEIPEMSYEEQIKQNGEGKVSTYVPFRNGLMLAAMATLAQSIYPEDEVDIYLGAHSDDAAGDAYADCSIEFVEAMCKAINIGTYKKASIIAPFVGKHKADIVAEGLRLGVPYELTWSCYKGGDKACGKCGTCIDRQTAFEANGTTDPIDYE